MNISRSGPTGPLAKDDIPIWSGMLAWLRGLTSKRGCPILEGQGDGLPKIPPELF